MPAPTATFSNKPCAIFSQHPESTANADGDYTYSEHIRPYFNFGVADIDVNGNLNFSIINTDNEASSDTLRPMGGRDSRSENRKRS